MRVACAMLAASLCVSLFAGWFWSSPTAAMPAERPHELARATADRSAVLVARGDALRLAVAATALADLTGGRAAFVGADGRVLVDTRPGFDGAADEEGATEVEVFHAGQRAGALRLWPGSAGLQPAFSLGLALVVFACSLVLAGIATALAHRIGSRLRAASHALRDHASGRPVRLAPARATSPAELAEFERSLRQLGTVTTVGTSPGAPVVELAQRLVVGLERQGLLVPGHGDRTARHAAVLAERLGMIVDDARDLELACRLHELGKAWLRPGLLRKEGVWDESDRESLRNHPARAASLLESVPGLQGAAAIVRSQCERHDGTGWPDGLRGDRIPLGARILALASRYDLIRSGIHGWALGTEAAVEQLRELRGSELDPWLVDLFAEAVVRVPEDKVDKAVRFGTGGVAASYLGVPADAADEEDADDTGEIELMAEGARREGT